MAPSVLRRRSATAAGLYLSVALGILGTIAAARILGLEDFGRFATVMAVVGLAQTLLDLTVEESLTKFGFRYVAAEDWGKLHRLFRRALELKLVGGALASLADPRARAVRGHDLRDGRARGADGRRRPRSRCSRRRRTSRASALLLRGRYDLRGALLSVTMAIRLVAILVGASSASPRRSGRWRSASSLATAIVGAAGRVRPPPLPAPRSRARSGPTGGRSSRSSSSRASPPGVISLRAALTPVLLGVVAGTTQVGYYRVALAPQSGFSAASAPVRLVLLTEQTRDWEHGREQTVLRGLRRYIARRGGRRRGRGAGVPRRDAVARARRVRRASTSRRSTRRASSSSPPRSSSCSAGRSRCR